MSKNNIKRCPHGTRWPHECSRCDATFPSRSKFQSDEDFRKAVERWEQTHAYR